MHQLTTTESDEDDDKTSPNPYQSEIDKIKTIGGIIRYLRNKKDYLATAAQLQSAFDCVGTLIDDLQQDNYDLQQTNHDLQAKLDEFHSHNDRLTNEIEYLKSSHMNTDEPIQQDNPAELPVIVLENPTKKPYSEILKSTKEHFRKIKLSKDAVDHVRPGPKGKTIVVCATQNDKTQLLESLKTQTELGAREAIERKRTLMIKNVPTSIKDVDFISDIMENDCRFTPDNFTLLRSFNLRDGIQKHIVVQTSEGIYRLLNNHPFVYFEYERYRAVQYISVKQCFNCSGIGHFANNCRARSKRCPSCSGEHSYKECTTLKYNCGLCSKTSDKNTDHKATSNNCPLRKKEFNILVKKHCH